jgi:hypothetical protein
MSKTENGLLLIWTEVLTNAKVRKKLITLTGRKVKQNDHKVITLEMVLQKVDE